MYSPLPNNLTIAPSSIHIAGLFATKDIEASHEFGITHVYDEVFQHNYIRTPLGGFFNHTEDPNCEACKDGRFIRLRSLRKIAADTASR